MLQLQQILFFREIGLELARIKAIIQDKDFDLVSALQTHRRMLSEKVERLNTLVKTVDATIMHVIGEVEMNGKKIFQGFSEEKQKRYEKEATRLWGDTVKESTKLWNSYTEQEKQEILTEGNEIYAGIARKMGKGPEDKEIQELLARWHQHLRHFYEPSIEILQGLGDMYADHPDFHATFAAIDPDLPAFLKKAVAVYVDQLETRWLERELAILEE